MILLDKYESFGLLGRGSKGQVHAARPLADPVTTVVVKIMRPDLGDSLKARENFDREVKYTSRLRHPYIVRVVDAGIDPVVGPCIVMEFVPGKTLEHVIEVERRLLVHRAGWLAGCLCHALHAAHATAIIHRDLKPANLMVVSSGTPQEHLKVMDFGLAHLGSKPFLSRERLAGEAVIEASGTPAYIAPEQWRGDAVDGRADLYSAGVVLFEALTGSKPFNESTLDALMQAHLRKSPPTFHDMGIRDIPAGVESVIRKCLTKFPAERPSSAREIADELGRALGIDLWKETTPITEVLAADSIPIAEDVPPETSSDPNALIRQTEAWMPDQIAVIKIGGFLQDKGAKIDNSQPGMLHARFLAEGGGIARMFGFGRTDEIALDLRMERPNPSDSRLVVTAIFRIVGGGAPKNRAAWTSRSLSIFEELRAYLMSSR